MDRRIALVTGASKGIGRGIAIELAAADWDVAVNFFRDADGAEHTATVVRAHGGRALALEADVGDSDQVQAMFARVAGELGPVDLVVNNAGVQSWAPLIDMAEVDFDSTIRTNLKGTFLCTQQAARAMKGRGGSIINIGSGSNSRPFPNLSGYCASKGGIQNLTVVAAVELGPLGIRVNCVAPGAVEIERTRHESPDYAGAWSPLTPLRRVGAPADVARAVIFLATDEASFITGQTLYVDGGLCSQMPWPYWTE